MLLAQYDMNTMSNKTNKYNYIKPKHYEIFTVEDLKKLIEQGKGIDVRMIAEAVGLDKDAYMFNNLKYNLRQNKPNEPRRRDVLKMKQYCEFWLEKDAKDHPNGEE